MTGSRKEKVEGERSKGDEKEKGEEKVEGDRSKGDEKEKGEEKVEGDRSKGEKGEKGRKWLYFVDNEREESFC